MNDINETKTKELLPYLILDEVADVDSFITIMEEEGIIAFDLKWRYYYGYNDAIRTIDFVETKGIYDAWAVFLPRDCQSKADLLVQKHSSILNYFEPAEEQFFRGLKITDLKKALASQQMKNGSLKLALKILKEEGITYSAEEIQLLKDNLVLENSKKAANAGRTKILIWGIIIAVIFIYLYLVGMF